MHLCIHTCMHIHKCMHIRKCMHAYACMHIHKCIHTCMHAYMYIVVNFNAVAQASNIWIGRRQFVFLCWMRDSVFGTESPADWMPADKPTEPSRIKLKTWTQQPVPMISEHSAHSTPLPVGFRNWLWQYTCFFLLIFYALTQASDNRIESRRVVFLCSMLFNDKDQGLWNRISNSADWMAADKPTELSRIKLKSTTFLIEFYSINVLVFLLQFRWNMLPRAQYKIRNRSYT